MSYFYQNPLIIVAILTILLSPFVLKSASNQGKKTKQSFKSFFIFILCIQILLGFLNWENFTVGKSGFELSLTYLNSFLGLFFVISIFQMLLLFIKESFVSIVVLNFLNTVLIFLAMIRLSTILGFQAASFASIGAVFLVLIGNVTGLILINKDKNLLKKYFRI